MQIVTSTPCRRRPRRCRHLPLPAVEPHAPREQPQKLESVFYEQSFLFVYTFFFFAFCRLGLPHRRPGRRGHVPCFVSSQHGPHRFRWLRAAPSRPIYPCPRVAPAAVTPPLFYANTVYTPFIFFFLRVVHPLSYHAAAFLPGSAAPWRALVPSVSAALRPLRRLGHLVHPCCFPVLLSRDRVLFSSLVCWFVLCPRATAPLWAGVPPMLRRLASYRVSRQRHRVSRAQLDGHTYDDDESVESYWNITDTCQAGYLILS